MRNMFRLSLLDDLYNMGLSEFYDDDCLFNHRCSRRNIVNNVWSEEEYKGEKWYYVTINEENGDITVNDETREILFNNEHKNAYGTFKSVFSFTLPEDALIDTVKYVFDENKHIKLLVKKEPKKVVTPKNTVTLKHINKGGENKNEDKK